MVIFMRKVLRVLGRLLLLALVLAFLAAALFYFLRWQGYFLLPQEAAPRQWEVFGVDVSVYQGEVDWPALAAQGVDFAFIKADSPGETQADNFIDMVPVTPGALPPVVDIEFYGDNLENPPDQAHVHSILAPLLARLEEHYGVKPILYVTYRSYDLYLREGYEDHPLWVSSPMVAPFGKDWSFWQYSHSAELEGYFGDERHIDLNVFRGSEEEFRRFGLA